MITTSTDSRRGRTSAKGRRGCDHDRYDVVPREGREAEEARRRPYIINCKDDTNWGESARTLTPEGAGVDHIIQGGGLGTLAQSFMATKYEGVVGVIGFLGAGKDNQPTIPDTFSNICTVRGVYVGSKEVIKDRVQVIEANNIHPVLDYKAFALDKARKAYEYLWAQSHIGKFTAKINYILEIMAFPLHIG
ncbi:hypothetical protein AnigIFM60653_003052 [Aspergillus niger]|nr:hypothetical protein AnigIFM60653_003052 [Aspergillus niger]